MMKYCYCNEMKRTANDPKGFIERVEIAREEAGLGRYEFSTAIDQGSSYWSVWITRHKDRGGFPAGGIMSKMTEVLGVSMDYLLGKTEATPAPEPLPEIQTVLLAVLLDRIGARPAYGQRAEGIKASAGKGSRIPQGYDDSRARKLIGGNLPERIQLVEVEGECMKNILFPGDFVHVDTQLSPEIGGVVAAVRMHDETLVKFLREKDGHQYLESKDGTIIVPLDQYIRILGPVVDVQRSIWRMIEEAQ